MRFKGIKHFNKWRKKFYLGKDLHGNKLYPYDYVRLSEDQHGQGRPRVMCSRIFWNTLDGAFAHAQFVTMFITYGDRNGNGVYVTDDISKYFRNNIGKTDPYHDGYSVEKITRQEYLDWVEDLPEDRKKMIVESGYHG